MLKLSFMHIISVVANRNRTWRLDGITFKKALVKGCVYFIVFFFLFTISNAVDWGQNSGWKIRSIR